MEAAVRVRGVTDADYFGRFKETAKDAGLTERDLKGPQWGKVKKGYYVKDDGCWGSAGIGLKLYFFSQVAADEYRLVLEDHNRQGQVEECVEALTTPSKQEGVDLKKVRNAHASAPSPEDIDDRLGRTPDTSSGRGLIGAVLALCAGGGAQQLLGNIGRVDGAATQEVPEELDAETLQAFVGGGGRAASFGKSVKVKEELPFDSETGEEESEASRAADEEEKAKLKLMSPNAKRIYGMKPELFLAEGLSRSHAQSKRRMEEDVVALNASGLPDNKAVAVRFQSRLELLGDALDINQPAVVATLDKKVLEHKVAELEKHKVAWTSDSIICITDRECAEAAKDYMESKKNDRAVHAGFHRLEEAGRTGGRGRGRSSRLRMVFEDPEGPGRPDR